MSDHEGEPEEKKSNEMYLEWLHQALLARMKVRPSYQEEGDSYSDGGSNDDDCSDELCEDCLRRDLAKESTWTPSTHKEEKNEKCEDEEPRENKE
jgi:hypothetical protein